MKVVGLFAGIGGLELGLHQAGHQSSLLCEILPTAKAVLAAKFPNAEIVDDILNLKSLPKNTDLLSAGFPCQDLSQAGSTQGLGGSRSALVLEVIRLARKSKPRWILLENVPFMLQLGGGAAMRRIVSELEVLKYKWAWRVVDTFGFGLPQRRERVFLLASREMDPADVLLTDDEKLDRPITDLNKLAHGFYWTEGRGGLGWAVDAIPTLKNGSSVGIASPPAILLPGGRIIKPDIQDAERLQGFDADWTKPAEAVGRPSLRWSLAGNAVSVPIAAWIGRRLAQPGQYDRERDAPFPDEGRLPKAARWDGKHRKLVRIGLDPLGVRPQHLQAFLKHPGDLLSERATEGFYSRTQRAKLRFQPGFIEAIREHLAVMKKYNSTLRAVA